MSESWDMGDPEPPDDVIGVVTTVFTDEDCEPIGFGRMTGPGGKRTGEWKGYLFGGKVYLSWDELTRRFGPVQARERR